MKHALFFLSLFALPLFANMPPKGFNAYRNGVFVETGTYLGREILNAKWAGFKEYHSIESNYTNYIHCLKRFKNDPSVHLYFGNSGKRLFSMIESISEPITFWLDASVYPPIEGMQNCPLMEELAAIDAHPIKTHTLLIDDISCAGSASFDGITILDLVERILQINPDYEISFIAGGDSSEVPNNILVATVPGDQN